MSKKLTEKEKLLQEIAQHEMQIAKLKTRAKEIDLAIYPILGKMLVDECLKDDILAMNVIGMIERLPSMEKKKAMEIIPTLRSIEKPQNKPVLAPQNNQGTITPQPQNKPLQ